MTVKIVLLGLEGAALLEVEQSLAYLSGVAVERSLSYYPESTELVRLLRAVGPDLLLVSTTHPQQMELVVQQALTAQPQIQMILLDWTAHPETLRRAMQIGVRECLTAPFSEEDLQGAIERSMTRRTVQPAPPSTPCALYSFLPAKPGVGASTLAVQTALALPQRREDRTLLLDADLEGGMVRFMLQLENPYGLVEALERVQELDENLWPQLVAAVDHLDVLHAGEVDFDYRMDLPRFERVLSFARRQYSSICVDLPGLLNRAAVEIMSESKAIFLVTTTEVASLHMARLKVRQLRDLQLSHQVQLIVNRMEKRPLMSQDEISRAVGLPVEVTFANEYMAVQRSLLLGRRLQPSNVLGQQVNAFAARLRQLPSTETAPIKKRHFLEGFSLARRGRLPALPS